MPSVPRFESPTVAPQGLPVPQAQGAPEGAFGVGLGQGVQQAAQGLGEIARKQQEDMDAARITAAIPQLDDAEHQVMTAAQSKQGWDALPVHDQAVGDFDKATSQIVGGLANARQKAIVSRMAAQQRGSISTQLGHYTNSEIKKAQETDIQVASVSKANAAISHYQDPTALAQDMQIGEGAIRSYGVRAGLAPETVNAQVAQWTSGVHVRVVETALQDGNRDFAKSYLAQNRDAIAGSELGRLDKAVRESDVLGQAFAVTDKIMASATNLADAQKQVREISDPEVRQHAQAEVDQRFQEQEAAHRISENHLYEGWSTQLERNGDGSMNRLRAQMGADWFKLDTSSRESLENRARQIQGLAAGVPVKTNEHIWTEFTLATPEEQAQYNPEKDLLPYLSESDYQSATQYISQLRNGGKTAVASETDQTSKLLAAAQGLSIVPRDPAKTWSDTEVLRFNNMKRAMDLQVQQFRAKTNRAPDQVETQKMVDGLMNDQLKVQRSPIAPFFSFLGTKSTGVPASSVVDADVADMTEKDLAAVQIPADAVQKWSNRFQGLNGHPITRVDLVRLWLAAQRHDRSVWASLGMDGPQ